MQVNEESANILIVDDLPEKLLVFRTILEDLGQNLVLVRSGADALREVLHREFAVIMLDVNMPGIDGFETAALIRQHRRSAHTPIIFITSYVDEMQTARGYSLGAVDYILSPPVPAALRSKVGVFVSLYQMQRQVQLQADSRAAMMAAEAGRRVAEESDRRSAFLAHASRALSGSLEIQIAARQLVDLLVPALAKVAVVRLADGDFEAEDVVVAAAGASSRQLAASGPKLRLQNATGDALDAAMKERRPLLLGEADLACCDARAFGFTAAPAAWSPLRAAVALPLVFRGRVLGALLVGSDQTGSWDKAVLEEIGVRAATAFENARLYRVLQREIQDRRSAQEELQQSNQRKDEFLAMMSHELRNPLAPIQTAIEVIRKVAAPQPKVTWALDIAQRQLKQMTRLIEELLDVARISQGKITLKREPIDLKAVIAQSVETVQPFIQSRRQTLTVGVPEHAVRLQGDAARLTQVIANLLHNASKYSGEDTQIELLAVFKDGEAVVTVRDQGIGIDAELLPHIFDLFAQGKRGLDRAQGGLGVGLTLARRLTELHGGRIEASSAGQDSGSIFEIRLPCIALLHEVASAPSYLSVAMAPQRVLVVDDNLDAAKAMATVLEMEGHAVLTAEDGEGALAAIEGFKPTVVLLDIGLPLLDGYAVARQMRCMALTKNALLIALTGYGQKEDQQAAMAAGFDEHFVKPADVGALLECIQRWSIATTPDMARRTF